MFCDSNIRAIHTKLNKEALVFKRTSFYNFLCNIFASFTLIIDAYVVVHIQDQLDRVHER